MQVGIDSYSYHRRYGEFRPGEDPLPNPWVREAAPVLEHARSVGADVVFLETCYLPAPQRIDADLVRAAEPVAVRLSWGHPWPAGQYHGLDGGRSPAAEEDLAAWIDAAARLGNPTLRITANSPASRGDEPAEDLIARLVAPMQRAADRAAAVGLSLALENHGDMQARDILELFDRADRPNLGVCLDNVNLIRVGDDMLEGTAALARHTLLVQLKDHRPGDPTMLGGPVSTALGEGVAPIGEVIEILDRNGFDGPVCVELASLGSGPVDELAMIARSMDWLRTHIPVAAG